VDYVLAKLAEEDKSITAHLVKEELEQAGDTRYIPVDYHAPAGWAKIDDKLFTVYGKPTVTVSEAFDKQLRERLLNLAAALGIKHERRTSIGGTRLGYATQGGKIVTKFGSPDSVIAHEIGHQLEYKYGLFDKLKDAKYPERTKELRALADLRFAGDPNVSDSYRRYVREKDEKIANAIAALVYAPRAFREVAPNTWDYLRDELHAIPALKPLLDIGATMTLDTGTAEVPVGGIVTKGHYWSPEPLARVVNNYLSPGVSHSAPYKALAAVNRTANMIELGMSWFHGLTVKL
jgi:hypothetical protein